MSKIALTLDEVRERLSQGKLVAPQEWPEANLDSKSSMYEGDLTDGLEGGVFDFIRTAASSMRFPVSSAMLFSMGAVACCTARTVWISPYGNGGIRPLTMYTAIGAKSGSGKSPMYKMIAGPIESLTFAIEKRKKKESNRIQLQIDKVIDEMRQLKRSNPDAGSISSLPEYKELKKELGSLEEELEQYKPIIWNTDQFNLQMMACTAADQDGYLAVMSEENEAVDFLTGKAAGIETSLVRKGYDGSSFYYGRQGLSLQLPYVTMGICLAGQENIIDMLISGSIKLGGHSNGLFERFFVLEERGVTGMKAKIASGEPVTKEQQMVWSTLIRNIVNMDFKLTLTMSNRSIKMLDDIHLKYDARCLPGDIFSTEPMLGMVQKSTAHISNIAGILHVMKTWSVDLTGTTYPSEVSDETVLQASRMFSNLVSAHLKILAARGFVGVNHRANEVRETISNVVARKKNRTLTNAEIQQAAGGKAAFRGGKKLTSSELFEKIYPSLENDCVLCVVGKKIYVNPNFA